MSARARLPAGRFRLKSSHPHASHHEDSEYTSDDTSSGVSSVDLIEWEELGSDNDDDSTFSSTDQQQQAHPAWHKPRWHGPQYSTELLDLHMAHYEARHQSLEERLVLYHKPATGSASGLVRGVEPRVQVRWLHVYTAVDGAELRRILRDVLNGYPFRAQSNTRKKIDWLRTEVVDTDKLNRAANGEPWVASDVGAIALSTPHMCTVLTTQAAAKRKVSDEKLFMDLLNHDQSRPLHVKRISSFLLALLRTGDTDLLFTVSMQPLAILSQDLIEFRPTPDDVFCAVRVVDRTRRGKQEYSIVIEQSCSYVEFLRQVVLSTSIRVDGRRYVIESSREAQELTAKLWLRLMREKTIRADTLSVRKVKRVQALQVMEVPMPSQRRRRRSSVERRSGQKAERQVSRDTSSLHIDTQQQSRELGPARTRLRIEHSGALTPEMSQERRRLVRHSGEAEDEIGKEAMALVVWSPARNVLNGGGYDIGPGARGDPSGGASDRSRKMMDGIEMSLDRSRDRSEAETMSSDASQDETSGTESKSEDEEDEEDEEGEEDEEEDEESEEGDTDEAHQPQRAVADMIQPEMSTLTLFPFFTWAPADVEGARQPNSGRQPRADKAAVRVLAHVARSMSSSPQSRFYNKGFRCTYDTLRSRLMVLSQRDNRDLHHFMALGALLDRTREFLAAFVPRSHRIRLASVIQSVWGAIDEQIRHLRFYLETQRVNEHGDTMWTVRIPVYLSDRVQIDKSCTSCEGGQLYSSIATALRHVHEQHPDMHCHQAVSMRKRGTFAPSHDPCFAWIHRAETYTAIPASDRGHWHYEFLFRSHVSDMATVISMIRDVQSLVARPHQHSQVEAVSQCLPLPRSLVMAFQQVLHGFLATSKTLSIVSKRLVDDKEFVKRNHESQLWTSLSVGAEQAMDHAFKHLEQAARDVVLCATDGQGPELVSSQKVNALFLATTLLSKAQNGNVNTSRSATNLSTIEHYNLAFSQLQQDASRRPRRSLFKDVSAYEGSLRSFRGVLHSQYHTMQHLRDVLLHHRQLAPTRHMENNSRQLADLFPKSPTDGERSTPELRQVQKQLQHLQQQDAEVELSMRRLEQLKASLVQAIEILDEGHGRAIRVFTIVTLVFLPLSFVTSFMGMNTTDIRDTTYDQSIYWATALPVTVVTVVVAFVYSYYAGDVMRIVRGVRFRYLHATHDTRSTTALER